MIHHATAASATRNGITLVEEQTDAGFITVAIWGDSAAGHRGQPGEKAKDVLADAVALKMISSEYRELLETLDRDAEGLYTVTFNDEEFSNHRLADLLLEVQEYASEQGLEIDNPEPEIEDEAEDEEKGNSSIVKAKYRQDYKARGNANHCGDWLAKILNEVCGSGSDDGFNAGLFRAVCDCNGVDHSKYVIAKRGDAGRMRMSCSISMRKKIGAAGVLVIPATGDADDQEITVPEEVRASPKYAPAVKKPKGKKAA